MELSRHCVDRTRVLSNSTSGCWGLTGLKAKYNNVLSSRDTSIKSISWQIGYRHELKPAADRNASRLAAQTEDQGTHLCRDGRRGSTTSDRPRQVDSPSCNRARRQRQGHHSIRS